MPLVWYVSHSVPGPARPPRTVIAASLCVAAYGVAILLGGLTATQPGSRMPSPILRMEAILALAGWVLAFALWHRTRWAWFAAVPYAAWFTTAGLLTIANYASSEDVRHALAPLGAAFFGLGVISVGAALVLLLLPATRAEFRGPAV